MEEALYQEDETPTEVPPQKEKNDLEEDMAHGKEGSRSQLKRIGHMI